MVTAETTVGIPRAPGKRAHANLLMAGINAALEHGLIGRRDGENYWPGAPEAREHTFRFTFPGDIPAAAYMLDIGGELSFHVTLWPKADLRAVAAMNGGFDAGEAFVVGWLEREHGMWLQDCFEGGRIRRALVPQLAEALIEPAGYHIGPFIR